MREIFPCREFEAVDIPLDALLVGGRINVYPEVTGKGYFDIDYRANRLTLTARSYVGLVPLNDRVAIHVIPRFPINNLFYVLQRASASFKFISGYLRDYSTSGGEVGDVAQIFGERMLNMLAHVKREGLLRHYVRRVTDTDPIGALKISDTVSKYRAHGIRFRQVRETQVFSVDIPENRLIKRALTALAGLYSTLPERRFKDLAKSAKNLLIQFDQVGEISKDEVDYVVVHRWIANLPNIHKPYSAILWLAYLICAKRGIAVEQFGPITFDTFVINLADVFEDFVRRVVFENVDSIVPGGRLKNGNIDNVPLFIQGGAFNVKPDMYLVQNRRTVVVLDAKYKPAIKAPDRYEILAFCEALQARKAVIVSPSSSGKDETVLNLGKTLGGIEMHIVRIDLGAQNIQAEEASFVKRLRTICSSLETVAVA